MRVKAAFGARVHELIARYFSDPRRTLHFDDGDIVLHEGRRNDRIYYVRSGQLIGHSDAGDHPPTDLLIVGAGEFAGVRSFSAPDAVSTATVRSDGASVVSYATMEDIREQATVSPEQVLLPIFIQAMLSRQRFVYERQAAERDMARRIGEMQEMSQLGQFAAGVAHELNNAISVIDRGAEWLSGAVEKEVERRLGSEEYVVFKKGVDEGRRVGSREGRVEAKRLVATYGLSSAAARDVAQMGLDDARVEALAPVLRTNGKRLHRMWELGATFYDVSVAARQAAGVVESMKHLGGRHSAEPAEVDVHETLHLALTIMRGMAVGVCVDFDLAEQPVLVRINKGELVQVWVNIIHNACDAMPDRGSDAGEARARLLISSRLKNNAVLVEIRDTGGGVDPDLLQTIFRPNFTTKKSGLSFGLGIGLSIVRRIITAAGGSVRAANWEKGASFTVALPLTATSSGPESKDLLT